MVHDRCGSPRYDGRRHWEVFAWPSLAIYVKRWHDRGKSGWWVLIVFVPIIGYLWLLIECGFLAGDDGPNEYGPDPLTAM
jgi:uncharacterized membrane protein YhaH (DUF805 family)